MRRIFSMSKFTASKWPLREASISAVRPSCRAAKGNTTEGFEGQQHERGHDPSPPYPNQNLTPNHPPLHSPPLPTSKHGRWQQKIKKYLVWYKARASWASRGGRGKRRGRLPPRRLIPRAHLVCMVHVGAFLDERVHHRQVASEGSPDQRRVAILPRAQGKHHGGVRGSAT